MNRIKNHELVVDLLNKRGVDEESYCLGEASDDLISVIDSSGGYLVFDISFSGVRVNETLAMSPEALADVIEQRVYEHNLSMPKLNLNLKR